jgi:hypothetical protein
MPAVPIKNREQYIKAIEVLDRVGGTWQGVGQTEWHLLVTPAQYKALVEANVVPAPETPRDAKDGKNSRKAAKS